jgi:hypothetical protein
MAPMDRDTRRFLLALTAVALALAIALSIGILLAGPGHVR